MWRILCAPWKGWTILITSLSTCTRDHVTRHVGPNVGDVEDEVRDGLLDGGTRPGAREPGEPGPETGTAHPLDVPKVREMGGNSHDAWDGDNSVQN